MLSWRSLDNLYAFRAAYALSNIAPPTCDFILQGGVALKEEGVADVKEFIIKHFRYVDDNGRDNTLSK